MTLARVRSLPWLIALGVMVAVGLFSYVNGRNVLARQAAVRETLAAREAMAETLSLLKDAETGGRGFLLTGDEKFLEPYENARPRIQGDLQVLARLGQADPSQRAGATQIGVLAQQKLVVLSELISQKRRDELLPRDSVRMLEQGKAIMDTIRVEIGQMLARADVRLSEREAAAAGATFRLALLLGAALLGGVVLTLAGLSSARRDAEQARLTSAQLARDVAARERAEIQLRDQTRLLESVLTNIGDAVLVVDHERVVLMMNPAAARVAPYVIGQKLSVEWSRQVQTYLPDGKTMFPPEGGPLTRALQGHASDGVEMMIRVPTGELRSYSVTTRPMTSDGVTVAAVAVFRDMTELRLALKDLRENEQRYRILSDASFEGVAITHEGRIQDSNANFARWLGYEPSDLVGMTGISFFPPEEQARVLELSLGQDIAYESKMLRRDGSTFPVEVRGRFAKFRNETVRIAVIRDITEKKQQEAELHEKSEQLRALSLRDELTGLRNRRGFMEVAEQMLESATRAGEPCTVFFADLNGMKLINDQLGHEAGDQALCAAGQVLTDAFRPSDVIARLGGDEFAVFAGECDDGGVASACATLERAVSEWNETSSSRYRLSISVGAAVFNPKEPRELSSLMQTADANMYDAKRARHQRASLRVRSG